MKAENICEEKIICLAQTSEARVWNWRKIAVTIGVWSALGLLFTPQTYLVNQQSPIPLNWWQAFF